MYRNCIKRLLDIVISLCGIVILSPIYLLLAVMVGKKLGTPVIFRQERPGKNEKIFQLYKFRSMTDERDDAGELLPDEARLTPFGKKLRSTSLDELPELFNILRGDMSLIGPRPLLVRYLPRYSETQRRRHDVRPGLTGLAQVNGRNAITWEQKFAYDVEYVDHLTFAMDVGIFLKTVRAVLKHEGINSETSATMEEFMG